MNAHLRFPVKAGDAHLLGQLAGAFGIEGSAQEESDLGRVGVELVGESVT